MRRADDVVERWQKVAGKAATREESPDRKCYSCHVHGGPIMNELTEPWTNWVSSHKTLSRPLTGASRALVSESRPFSSEHTRSSLANQLEQVTRTAISTWVEGLPGLPGSGFGAQTMAGKQPGGAALLLRSVFCQTEVNFASAFDTVPVALFADASVANLAGLEPPVTPVSGAAFELVPVRAETDLRIERFLQKAGLLEPDTVLAVRLFDDMHDVFSEKRCAVHADATGRLPAKSLDAAVAAAILASLDTDEVIESNGDTSTTTHAQRVFIRALLDPTTPPAHRDEAESAYIVDITSRYAAETSKLNTKAGKAELQRRWRERQASARAMFPTAATPLPLMNAP